MKTLRYFLPVLGSVLVLSGCHYPPAQPSPPATAQKPPTPAAATNAGAAQSHFQIAGKVVDNEGRAVAGAIVECYTFGGGAPFVPVDLQTKQRVTTSTDGAFELSATRGPVALLAQKSGLAPAWRQYAILTASKTEERLVLTPPSVLAGVVVDETEQPVPNAVVSVASAYAETELESGARSHDVLSGKLAKDCYTTRTSTNGQFRIEGFPTNATAELAVAAPGKALRQTGRDSSRPDTSPWRAGQEDIKLVVEPAGAIEGKIVYDEPGEPPIPVRLTLQPGQPGAFQSHEPVQAETNGVFRFSDVAAGAYRIRAMFGTNAVPDWVAELVPVNVESGRTTGDVRVLAIHGGLLEVAVSESRDHKPAAQVNVNASKDNFQSSAASDSNGIVRLRLPPGDYRLLAVVRQSTPLDQLSASVEAGKTNRAEIEVAAPQKITGVVHRPDGQPATGLPVRVVFGFTTEEAGNQTDANGRFEVAWQSRRSGMADATTCLLIRDLAHNLAVAQDIDEDTSTLDLKLEPGLTLAGRVECDGKPVTNATAALIFWTGRGGMHLPGLSRATTTPGRFEIPALPPGRKYGIVASARGYGQKTLYDVGAGTEAETVELDPMELKIANLTLAGQVLDADEKPVAGIYVNLYGEDQPTGNARTDREGWFKFDHVCEGTARLSANAQNSYGTITAEGGDTNVVLRLGQTYAYAPGSTVRKITGTVTDPEGTPVVGADVSVFPAGSARWIKTGANGGFHFTWTVEPWLSQSGAESYLVVRHEARNLAAAETISEDATNLDVRLKPALTVTGLVTDTNSVPLTNAEVGIWFRAGNNYSNFKEQPAAVDSQGRFMVRALPVDGRYAVYAKAKGYGRSQQDLQSDSETNQVELAPFALKLANLVVAGKVVNADDKPVSGVNVNLSGEGQPDGYVTTDSKGRFSFKVCEGQIRLFASSQNGYAQASVEAGDTNVLLQLTSTGSVERSAPKRVALTGKPLPDLAAFGLGAEAAPAGKPLLLCLLDVEQRPSRRLARSLSEQYHALKDKGIVVLGVQAVPAADDAFGGWMGTNSLPFPIGRAVEKSEKSRWVSQVESLPWLILADASHRVVAEGFALEELETQLKAISK